MDFNSKIYIAGHRGMVGSAIKRALEAKGFSNLVFASSQELVDADLALMRRDSHLKQGGFRIFNYHE